MSYYDITIAGDYHIYGAFDKYIRKHPDAQIFSQSLKNHLNNSYFNIFNLEDPITISKKKIVKFGPHGKGSSESLIPIKNAGFHAATFATNHTYDYGELGIVQTIKSCEDSGIEIMGVGDNLTSARKIFYKVIDEFNIAFLNYSRKEFNFATNERPGANPLDVINILEDLKIANLNAEYTFLIIHEGGDLCEYPSPAQVRMMRFFAENGASAILIHHSRLVSGYEVYKGIPIFYGLGNLLHITKERKPNGEHFGLLVSFRLLENKKIEFNLFPMELDISNFTVGFARGEKRNNIFEHIASLSNVISNSDELKGKWGKEVIEKKRTQYLVLLSGFPYFFFRILRKLKIAYMLNKVLSRRIKRLLLLQTIIRCESKSEEVDYVISKIIENK